MKKRSAQECIQSGRKHANQIKRLERQSYAHKIELAKDCLDYCKVKTRQEKTITEFAQEVGIARTTLHGYLRLAKIVIATGQKKVTQTQADRVLEKAYNKDDNREIRTIFSQEKDRDTTAENIEKILELLNRAERTLRKTTLRLKDRTELILVSRICGRMRDKILNSLEKL